MAIPYQPQNLETQQADGNILLTWSAALDATGYSIQRSTDGTNYTALTTVGQVTQYLDALPGVGILYYYQIAATNGSGTSTYSTPAQMVAAPPAEMSLLELRLRSKETADRVASNFVTTTEWNAFLRLAMYELYDLLITTYEDYFASQTVFINTNGTTQNYPVPDGATNYFGGTYPSTGSTNPAQAFYKMAGMDLGINTSNNAWVTLLKFDFIERNKYVYPNSTSTIYGVYNMRYRLMGSNINIIPTPAGNQQIRMWYSPRLPALLMDSDLTTLGTSGWLRYPIVRAAKYALDKEESDSSKLDAELVFLKQRIEQSAANRDAGIADTISNTRQDPLYGGTGFAGGGGAQGGWVFAPLALIPCLASNDVRYGLLIDSILASQLLLGALAACIFFAYYLYFRPSNFGRRILFSWMGRLKSFGAAAFRYHIGRIIHRCPKKQMVRSNTAPIVTFVTNKKTVWDVPKMKLPRNSMGMDVTPLGTTTKSGHTTISRAVDSTGVVPAPVRFPYVFPKSLNIYIHRIAAYPIFSGWSSGW